jgi:hypothetical protein
MVDLRRVRDPVEKMKAIVDRMAARSVPAVILKAAEVAEKRARKFSATTVTAAQIKKQAKRDASDALKAEHMP